MSRIRSHHIIATIDLACIPGFAGVYQHFCPGDFYATAAHYEPSWTIKERGLQHILQPAMERSAKELADERSELSADEVRALESNVSDEKRFVHLMIIDHVEISRVRFDGTFFRFNASFRAKAVPDVGYSNSNERGYIYQFIFLTGEFHNSWDSPAGVVYTTRLSSGRSEPHPGAMIVRMTATRDDTLSLDNPFLRSLAPEKKMIEGRVVYLNDPEALALQKFIDEYNGVSEAIGRDYFRMLYLSGVVITTLGLGDIVPLTPLARALVWIEAVVGIVLAGFFLNAVSNSRKI